MIWSEVKEIWVDGPREYVNHLWNVLDFGMLSIFVASFTARFMAFLKASKAQLYVDQFVTNEDIRNASLPTEVAYYTYGAWKYTVGILIFYPSTSVYISHCGLVPIPVRCSSPLIIAVILWCGVVMTTTV